MSQTQNTNIETPATKSTVDPDALMGKINGLSFLAMFIVSLLVHTVLIGATSVGFIQDCIAYKTLDPDSVLQEQAKKAQAAKEEKARAKAEAATAKAKLAEMKAAELKRRRAMADKVKAEKLKQKGAGKH